MKKRILAIVLSVFLTLALSVTVSAATVFEKDFTDGELEPMVPALHPTVSQFELCSYEFTDAGLRLYNIDTNYKSYVIPFGKTGMELNSDKHYLITFEGIVNVDNPSNYEMIVQLFGVKDDGADNWININGKDGTVVSDAAAYPINEDGTFKVEALVTPDQLSFDKQGNIDQLCVWGKYGNHPRDYTISLVKIEECDANGNVEGSASAETTVAAGNTNDAVSADKGSADTGIEGIAALAGITLIATGAVIISRKRK